ncbi:hypothetical Protein YC6258_04531 [Gynuella sunshinyii YC6258]|uniref:Uncharacterized protein n=1 Tax=Gynuella sunshinyii YC6258 TaxID=1445510 RepID=A0A0C5VTB6_9GAMM|nr:hypothetical Protein YC6258_04531 [Gynuella sunshinyii YC6258]
MSQIYPCKLECSFHAAYSLNISTISLVFKTAIDHKIHNLHHRISYYRLTFPYNDRLLRGCGYIGITETHL